MRVNKPRRKSPVETSGTERHLCDIHLRLKLLGMQPFFAGLSSQDLEGINKRFVESGYGPGETIYYAGDPAERLYVLAEGKVKLLQHAPSGRDILLDFLTSGEFFGSLASLGTAEYSNTAQAQTAVCALSIRSEEFRQILDAHPEVALKVLDILSRRLKEAHEQVLQISAIAVEKRIARSLLRLGDKLGVPHATGLLIDVPLSRDELAEMTGSTPETASRVMSQLQGEGIIASGRQWVAIIDRARLEAVAGE